MAPEQITEEELRRICLDATSRGEPVGYILHDYLYLAFLHEQQEADRAASHRAHDTVAESWAGSDGSHRAGRHRLAS